MLNPHRVGSCHAPGDETWHLGTKVAGSSKEMGRYRRQERSRGMKTEPSEHQSPSETPNLISSAWFHCGDAKQLNTYKTGRTPELTEMSGSASGTKRSLRKGQNVFLHELLNRLFTPLKRELRKLHVTPAHGVGDPRLWHLARLDSEHFMEG